MKLSQSRAWIILLLFKIYILFKNEQTKNRLTYDTDLEATNNTYWKWQ